MINDGNETSPTVTSVGTSDQPYSNNCPRDENEATATSSSTLNAKEISNCLSDVELATSAASSSSSPSSYQQPSPVAAAYTQQQQLDPSPVRAYRYQQDTETNGLSAQQLQQMQFLAQHQMPPMGQQSRQGFGTEQPAMMNVALQFMQAMQQSVQQVANTPHFGFEWVKPDYQFDPVSAFAESNQAELKNDIQMKTSPVTVQSPPLTDRDMEELFDVLQEYGGKEIVNERLLTTGNIHG